MSDQPIDSQEFMRLLNIANGYDTDKDYDMGYLMKKCLSEIQRLDAMHQNDLEQLKKFRDATEFDAQVIKNLQGNVSTLQADLEDDSKRAKNHMLRMEKFVELLAGALESAGDYDSAKYLRIAHDAMTVIRREFTEYGEIPF